MARVLPESSRWLARGGDLELGLRWEPGARSVEVMSWPGAGDKCRGASDAGTV